MRHHYLINLIIFALLTGALLSADISCTQCGEPISGKYVNMKGKFYHEKCYREHIQPRCDHCGDLIEGKYTILDGANYHEHCYVNNIIPKCSICAGPLQGKYYTDFWENSFHASHSSELPECSTCGRLICEELTGGGFELSDGRYLCAICNETAVEGDFLMASSVSYVRRLLASNGIDNLPPDIPITLVDRNELRSLASSYSDAMNGFTQQNMQTRNGQVISKSSHIYVLDNLPLTMFRAVLAHEYMHVYLFERDLELRSDICEGFCNLGSEMVYKDTPSEYARFRLQNMQEDQDPDYGYGYRKMSRILEQRGWRYLLETLDQID